MAGFDASTSRADQHILAIVQRIAAQACRQSPSQKSRRAVYRLLRQEHDVLQDRDNKELAALVSGVDGWGPPLLRYATIEVRPLE